MSQGFLRVIGINLGDLTADPANGVAGDMYFNPNTQTARIFANGVWADFGTAATTITTPTVTSVSPSNGNISSLSQTIVVTFSEAMNTGSTSPGPGIGNKDNYIFSSDSGTVHIDTIDVTLTTATLHTSGTGVNSGGTITLTPTSNIQAATGAVLAASASHSYTYIPPSSAPTILSWSPAASAITALPSTIAVTFSTASMNHASTSDPNSVTNKANWSISSTAGDQLFIAQNTAITYSGSVATLPLTGTVTNGATITVAALNTIQDTSLNALSGGLTVSYPYSTAGGGGGGGTTSANFQASQENGRKPSPNYALNMDVSLTTKSCKNETFGVVLQLTASANTTLGATGLPAGFSLKWFKMQPITITTPTITGGVAGTYYDPLIPIGNTLKVAAPGTPETDWLWCDITVASSVAAGPYSFTLTAGTNTIPVTHTVWNYTIPAVPFVPMYIKADGFSAAMQMYGSAINTPTLNLQTSTLLHDHRISTMLNSESWAPLANSGDATQGLNLSTYQSTATSFNAMAVSNTLGAQWLPLHSQYLGLFNNDSSVKYWAPIGAGAAAQAVTGTTYAQACHYELNKPAQSAIKFNNFSYFLDEPNWAQSGMLTGVQTELNAIKTAGATQIKIMITTELKSEFIAQTVNGSPMDLVDIWCPIQSYINQSGHVALSSYAGKGFWTYGADRSHTWNFGSGDGSPDLMVDQDSHHCVAYPIVSYIFGATGTLYYYATGFPFWNGVLGSSSDMWAPGGIGGDGNGDGKLVWVGRSGSYGLTSDQMLPSIRLKNLREGQNLIDMMHSAAKDGKDLVTDGLTWRTKYSDFMAYRTMIGDMLNGGSYVAPASAAPGEFYLTAIQAAAGTTIVTLLPSVNLLAPATSYELWASTTQGGPYTRKCGTYTGTITTGNIAGNGSSNIVINDTTGTAGTKYYYRAKGINASGAFTWSVTEKSATFSAANTTGPGSIAGLKLWYTADAGVTADGSGNITALTDQSPTGYNLTSAAGHRPTLVTGAYRGSTLPAIRFAGTGVAGTSVSTYQCLDGSSTPLASTIQAVTVIAVFNPADATTTMSFMSDLATTNFQLSTNNSGKLFSTGALTGPINTNAAAATGLQLVAYTSTAAAGNGQGILYVDGVLDKTGTASTDFPNLHWVRLGAGPNNGGFGAPQKYWFTGDLGEIAIWNRVLNSTELTNATAYFKNKWGIT